MLLSLMAAAVATTTLLPVGPWQVEVHPDTCVLTRTYDRVHPVTVGIQSIVGSDIVDVLIASSGVAPQSKTDKATVVVTGASQTILEARYVNYPQQSGNTRIVRLTADKALTNGLVAATTVRFIAPPTDLTIAITGFAKAAAALKTCQDDLLTSWGVDPAQLEPATPAKPVDSVQQLFSAATYPDKARDKGYQGLVVGLLNVSDRGAVGQCRVVIGGGPELNSAACKQLRKAAFTPARDTTGRAIASIYVIRVRWVLPTN